MSRTTQKSERLPLPQSGGCFVVEAGELRPDAALTSPKPNHKPAVKAASQEA